MMILIAEMAMMMATVAGVVAKTSAANDDNKHHCGSGSGKGG